MLDTDPQSSHVRTSPLVHLNVFSDKPSLSPYQKLSSILKPYTSLENGNASHSPQKTFTKFMKPKRLCNASIVGSWNRLLGHVKLIYSCSSHNFAWECSTLVTVQDSKSPPRSVKTACHLLKRPTTIELSEYTDVCTKGSFGFSSKLKDQTMQNNSSHVHQL